MDRHLHIVALHTPYPVVHGGLFDIFYKLSAFHRSGVRISLHCFDKGHGEQAELNKYCEKVYYYPRRMGLSGFSFHTPHIVASRASDELKERLCADDFPILLEGIHCTSLLQDARFANRKIILRLHNVEYKYYRQLYRSTNNFWKKLYYRRESVLLKKYEPEIAAKVTLIVTAAQQDAQHYQQEFAAGNVVFLPVFSGFDHVQSMAGSGSYCLYHGNLSVAENEKVAEWLIGEVFEGTGIPFQIAGRNPSRRLVRLVNSRENILLTANPSLQEMQRIIRDAQVHVLPSLNCTGIKLKLLNALYNGRHCVVNNAAIKDTGLQPACHMAESAADFKSLILQLFMNPFSEEEVRVRRNLLAGIFDSDRNIEQLNRWIW